MTEPFCVPVLYAGLREQFEEMIDVRPGDTVADALSRSVRVRALDTAELSVAIYGEAVSNDRVLAPGDRIELLRPLAVDPKEARRRRAAIRAQKR